MDGFYQLTQRQYIPKFSGSGRARAEISQQRLIRLVGDKELRRKLRAISGPGLRRVMRVAIDYALTPVLREAKHLVPRRTGMLYGAIEKRVRVTAKSTYGMIWINPLEKIGAGRLGEYGLQIHPRRYAHLVEFGTRHSRPKSFLRAAMINRRDEAMARLTEKARERLDIEWGKADAKGKLL